MESNFLRLFRFAVLIIIILLTYACSNNCQIVDKQKYDELTYYKTIHLKVDSLLCSQIRDFFPIGESSYVFTDGTCIYKTDNAGAIVKMINRQGHGEEEYLRISKVFSNGHNIYAWCGMSLQLFKYDMNLNFIDKYQESHHAITKFIVTDNDTAYFLLAGGSVESIGILPLNHNGKLSYCGYYRNEDNALLLNGNSGGITVYNNQVKYVTPSEMKVWNVGKDDTWSIKDGDFVVENATRDLGLLPDHKMLDYVLSNSICSGLYGDNEYLWLIAETGSINQDETGMLTYDNRFLNLYKVNSLGRVISSYMYNYPVNAINYIVSKGCLHLMFNDGNSYTIKQHIL